MKRLFHEKQPLAAVLFDLDGTLIDSIDAYRNILNEVYARLSVPAVSRERVVAAMQKERFDWDDILPMEVRDDKDEFISAAQGIIGEVYSKSFRREALLIPGAAEILERIDAAGLRIGLVTSTHKKYLREKLYPLEQRNVMGLFQAIVAIEDAPRVKPAADPLLECAGRLNVSTAGAVYVGDSPMDIRAGRAAKMKTIGVLTGVGGREDLDGEEPDAIIRSVARLGDVLDLPSS